MTEQPGSVPAARAVAYEAPRPTRAELRRAAEAGASRPSTPRETVQTAPAELSRTEQRRLADERARAARSQRAIWKAWWVYPVAAGIGICIWFGVQSAANQPNTSPSVVTTITAQP